MNATELARELGKLGAGHKKTMTPAAIAQRQRAAKSKRKRITKALSMPNAPNGRK